MSNLIITIISIALVAVTTLLAIFYGGPAMTNYNFSVMANRWIDGVAQTAAAGVLWRANYGVSSVCTSIPNVNAYNIYAGTGATGICHGDNLYYGWGAAGSVDKGKYVWPIAYVAGTFPLSFFRYFDKYGSGNIIYNNITYFGDARFDHDSKGDLYRLVISRGSNIGSGAQTAFSANDDFIKVCQKINKNVTIPPTVTIDPTFKLPISTATFNAFGFNWSYNDIGPGICYLQKFNNSTSVIVYYVRL